MPVGHRSDINLTLQALCLNRAFPHGSTRLTASRLTWHADVRPLPACAMYSLELTAERTRPPSIRVTAPGLLPDADGCLPHVYDDGSLCVSQFGDFRLGMLFVDTVVPWALEWLVYYELWLTTDTWFGDGPDRLDPESQSQILHPYLPDGSLPNR